MRELVSGDQIEQWGKIKYLDGGDTIVSSSLMKPSRDTRDATFAKVFFLVLFTCWINLYSKYEVLVDLYARQRRRQPTYEKKTLYGQLQHILVIRLPAVSSLNLPRPSVVIMAALGTCNEDSFNSLGMPYYSTVGTLNVVDLACVRCVVGRIPVGRRWAIVDRSEAVRDDLEGDGEE